jgi:hypothetical protein
MDISDYLLATLPPSEAGGGLADICSVAFNKRALQAASEARETIYMEEARYVVTWQTEEEMAEGWKRYWAGGER